MPGAETISSYHSRLTLGRSPISLCTAWTAASGRSAGPGPGSGRPSTIAPARRVSAAMLSPLGAAPPFTRGSQPLPATAMTVGGALGYRPDYVRICERDSGCGHRKFLVTVELNRPTFCDLNGFRTLDSVRLERSADDSSRLLSLLSELTRPTYERSGGRVRGIGTLSREPPP